MITDIIEPEFTQGVECYTTHYLYQNPYNHITEHARHLLWRDGWNHACNTMHTTTLSDPAK